jgi:two-component system chemotaxis response regulator CheY
MSAPNSNIKVLILSGQKEAATLIAKSLKNLGYHNITYMDNGVEALKKIMATPFDFITCDVNVKFISGWMFIKEIKLAEQIPNIPVLLFGQDDPPENDDILKKYGIIKYMKLPMSESQMNFAIHSTLSLFNTSGTIEHKYTSAKKSLISNDIITSIDLYSELHGLTSGSTRSSMGLAQSFIRANDKARAEQMLDQIAASNDDTPVRYYLLAKMALGQRDIQLAIKHAEKLLSTISNEFYYSRVARLFLDYNSYKEAELLCRQALEKKFDLAEFYSHIAKCKYASSSFEEALRVIEEAEDKFGMDTDLHNLRGVCNKKLGKFDAAIESYEEALKITPNDAKVFFNLAQCAIGMKDYTSAIKYLEACLKISPSFPNAGGQLAELKAKKAG